jgi:hypothetical protein
MSGHWVCKLCMLQHGLRGSDLKNWPKEGDTHGIIAHLHDVHGITVREYEDTDDGYYEPGER